MKDIVRRIIWFYLRQTIYLLKRQNYATIEKAGRTPLVYLFKLYSTPVRSNIDYLICPKFPILLSL